MLKAVFDVSSQGLGFPTSVWSSYSSLLLEVAPDGSSCGSTDTNLATCSLAGSCSENSAFINDYQFYVDFSTQTSTSANHLRVPISTFAATTTSGDTTVCEILVANLVVNPQSVALTKTVVFGGMFFQEFYAQFNNTYPSPSTVH